MKIPKNIENLLSAVGGYSNLHYVTHCATRLRLVLNDPTLVSETSLTKNPLVKGFFIKEGQFQIVIGLNNIEEVYTQFKALVEKKQKQEDSSFFVKIREFFRGLFVGGERVEVLEIKTNPSELECMEVYSPLSGEIKDLSECSDEAFATGTMGMGALIIPSEGKVYAPADCVVEVVFATNHALILEFTNGLSLLIHLGLDTFKLEGKGFTSHVIKGQEVKKGDLLLEFDLDYLKEEGCSLECPVLATNLEDLHLLPFNLKIATNPNAKACEDLAFTLVQPSDDKGDK